MTNAAKYYIKIAHKPRGRPKQILRSQIVILRYKEVGVILKSQFATSSLQPPHWSITQFIAGHNRFSITKALATVEYGKCRGKRFILSNPQ